MVFGHAALCGDRTAVASEIAAPSLAPGATRSTVDIAELTGKDHANVLRDVDNMLESFGIARLKFEGSYLGEFNVGTRTVDRAVSVVIRRDS
jgi:hypothetical protein